MVDTNTTITVRRMRRSTSSISTGSITKTDQPRNAVFSRFPTRWTRATSEGILTVSHVAAVVTRRHDNRFRRKLEEREAKLAPGLADFIVWRPLDEDVRRGVAGDP